MRPAGPTGGAPLFSQRRILATPGAMREFTSDELRAALGRHFAGDWGDLDAEDRAENQRALRDGTRLLSAYEVRGKKLWIITEAEGDDGVREATTLLLPSEY